MREATQLAGAGVMLLALLFLPACEPVPPADVLVCFDLDRATGELTAVECEAPSAAQGVEL